MIRVQVNGKAVELEGPTPLLDYLRGLGVDARAVAVEVNGEILERERYATCLLEAGDTVEIVRMVGGGAGRRRPASRQSFAAPVGTAGATRLKLELTLAPTELATSSIRFRIAARRRSSQSSRPATAATPATATIGALTMATLGLRLRRISGILRAACRCRLRIPPMTSNIGVTS
jgi:sulfur carrier protein